MYKVTPPRINTGIGVGAAQVFAPTDLDLEGLGYAIGYNSDKAKDARRQKEIDSKYKELGLDSSEHTPALAEKLYQEQVSIREQLESMANDPDFYEKGEQLLVEWKHKVGLSKAATARRRQKRGGLDKYDTREIDNLDKFLESANPDYFRTEEGELPSFEDMLAETYTVIEETGVRNNELPEMPKFATRTITKGSKSDDGTYSKDQIVFTNPEAVEQTFNKWFNAGWKSKTGATEFPSLKHENWIDQYWREFQEEERATLADVGSDPKALEEAFRAYVKPKFMLEAQNQEEVGAGNEKYIADNTTKEKDKGKDVFDHSKYTITTETEPNKSGKLKDEEGNPYKLGETQYVVSNTPEISVVTSAFENEAGQNLGDVESQIYKVRLDSEGNRLVYVKTGIKTTTGNPSKLVKTATVPYQEIKGQLNGEALEFMENHFKLMEEKAKPKTDLFTKEESEAIGAQVEAIRDSYANQSDKAQSLIQDIFGDEATEISDPRADTDDISFKYKGKTKTFDLDEPEERDAFVKLIKEHKKGSIRENLKSTEGMTAEERKAYYLNQIE